ncbi:MAG: two-component system response regulator KdpE [Betaproteobacteria bacterium]|nr:two-component system response regulator KdpE [Betaproteobacteria bacterium]
MLERGGVVLLVEDDVDIRRLVRSALEGEGHRVFEASTCASGLVDAGSRKPDLVILDLGLPDRDGTDFLRTLRGWSEVPVIVLSARSDEAQKVQALDLGADDYLTKPFGVAELLARVRATMRRGSAPDRSDTMRFGDVTVDFTRRSVERAGGPVHLTAIEFRLLCALLRHPGKVVTHRQLLREVWGPNAADQSHYLRVYMGKLRHRLEIDPARPRHFVTEVGVGYRFMP